MIFPVANTSNDNAVEPIRSSFVDDEDMRELVEMYVEDAPEKIEKIRISVESNDAEQLRVLAHQIKGSAAGYGFEPLSELARQLEQSAQTSDWAQIRNDASAVNQFLAAMRA